MLAYTPHLRDYLEQADLVVARAGGSVFEIAAAGKPSILVPSPNVTADHQTRNAEHFALGGAAVMVSDAELTPTRLRHEVNALLADHERRERMAVAATRLARPDAASVIARPAAGAGPVNWSRPPPAPARHRRRRHVGAGHGRLCLGRGRERLRSGRIAVLRPSGPVRHPGLAEHDPAHLEQGMELVVVVGDPADEPELLAARDLALPRLHRAELLAEMVASRRSVCVAGAHGKTTTTSAMIAYAAQRLGLDPTYLIGGEVPQLGGNAGPGGGTMLVAEADESDGSLSLLRPRVAVVLNIELDHHTRFAGMSELERLFSDWTMELPAVGRADPA